jgi:hypothetical protein
VRVHFPVGPWDGGYGADPIGPLGFPPLFVAINTTLTRIGFPGVILRQFFLRIFFISLDTTTAGQKYK